MDHLSVSLCMSVLAPFSSSFSITTLRLLPHASKELHSAISILRALRTEHRAIENSIEVFTINRERWVGTLYYRRISIRSAR